MFDSRREKCSNRLMAVYRENGNNLCLYVHKFYLKVPQCFTSFVVTVLIRLMTHSELYYKL